MNLIKKNIISRNILLVSAYLSACIASAEVLPARYIRDEAVVTRVEKAAFDQLFDHPAWRKTPAYDLLINAQSANDIRVLPRERASVRYLYDKSYLYIKADLADSDVVNHAAKSGGHLYAGGDLLEIFIKVPGQPYYWEIYGTPHRLHTVFYYSQQGNPPASLDLSTGATPIRVAARVNGSLNDPSDVDKGYSILLAVPRSELEKNGVEFTSGSQWIILASRYNYSRYLPWCEKSAYPQCNMNFHDDNFYARIRFEQ